MMEQTEVMDDDAGAGGGGDGTSLMCEDDVLVAAESYSPPGKCDTETYNIREGENGTIQFVSVPMLHDELNDVKTTWTRQMTRALIEEYTVMLSQFKNPEKRQKDLWIALAKKLTEKGYNVSWSMCDRKFRNLKQTYRTIYYSGRSERSKRRWEFYDDLSSLITPYSRFFPKRGAGTAATTDAVKAEPGAAFDDGDLLLQHLAEPDAAGHRAYPTPESYLEQCESEPPAWFRAFAAQLKRQQDALLHSMQAMHQEVKAIELRKVRLLENVLALLRARPAPSSN